MQFPKPIQEFIHDFARQLEMAEEEFVERVLIDYMARTEAGLQAKHQMLLWPFIKELCGEELFESLVEHYLQEMRLQPRQKEVEVMSKEHEKQRQDYRDQLELYQHQGLCPDNYYGPAGLACKYIEQHLEGKMSRPQLDKLLARYKR